MGKSKSKAEIAPIIPGEAKAAEKEKGKRKSGGKAKAEKTKEKEKTPKESLEVSREDLPIGELESTEAKAPKAPLWDCSGRVTITRSFGFEAAHRLPGHTGKCHNLHGHSYKVELEIVGPIFIGDWHNADYSGCTFPSPWIRMGTVASPGMVIDYGALEEFLIDGIREKLDHRTLLWKDDYLVKSIPASQVTVFDQEPTAEHLAVVISNFVKKSFMSKRQLLTFVELLRREQSNPERKQYERESLRLTVTVRVHETGRSTATAAPVEIAPVVKGSVEP